MFPMKKEIKDNKHKGTTERPKSVIKYIQDNCIVVSIGKEIEKKITETKTYTKNRKKS